MLFFTLGSHPTLSVAEIAAVLGVKKNYSHCSKEILLLDEVNESPEWLQNRLAGTVKIGDIVGEVKKINQDEMADLIVSLLPQPGRNDDAKRIVFGLSVYSCGAPVNELVREAKRLGMAVKKRLKENGQAARLVSVNTPALTSAAVTGEKLLENGGEFVLIATKEKILIGQTRTVQNFNAWSDRDYGRPARDAKSGMLPPKLARMMINLATSPPPSLAASYGGHGLTPPRKGGGILDPFCGSGTVLMEAALMGFTKIIGSDISEKAIKDTEENLKWLQNNGGPDISQIKLFVKPVENLGEELKEKVEALVAETYLGPSLRDRETPARLKQISDDLEKRTFSGLLAIRGLLKKNGVAVLALPVLKVGSTIHYLPIKKLAAAAELSIAKMIPENLPLELQAQTSSGGLIYSRQDQRVGREIIKLVKT
ncbi:MAG: DNA methyltransferase [Candidatus Uhrbacteria bacterium]